MLRSVMLIVNPYSGRGLSKSALGTIVEQLCKNGHATTVYVADGDNTPERLVCEYAKHHDLVVCAGGDGTLNAVVSGVLHSGLSIPVGYIPAGTANDVAATLALSRDPSAAVQKILEGRPRPIDIGLFDDRYFTYVAAFGAFTGVAYSTAQSAKRALGHFAYILGGLAEVHAIKAIHTVVEYDGGVIEGDYIFCGVLNSTSVAGLVKIGRKHVDLTDGMFEVILVKRPVGLSDFLDILASIATKKYDGDNVMLFHTSKVMFSLDSDAAWTLDGEDGGRHSTAEIAVCREAIKIIY